MRLTNPGRVLYVQYTNPAAYPPVDHGAQLLAAAGFQMLVLGTTDRTDDTSRLSMTPHDFVRVRTVARARRGVRQKLHFAAFAVWALIWTLRWRPTWVYASDPPACVFALLLARIPGVRVVYHEHDSPSAEVAIGGDASIFVRLIMWARRRLAAECDLVILPNDQRSAAYRDATGRQDTLTVWNCPLRGEVAASRTLAVRADRLRLVYHGSIVPARLPRTVVEALAALPEGVTLDIVGYETAGDPMYARDLVDLARRLGVGGRVRFHGVVPTRADLLRLCAQCDVGLALLPPESSDLNELAMVGASNKPFDYMACGLTVLVSDVDAWRTAFVEPGFAVSCDPRCLKSIAGAVSWLLVHPEARASMGERGRAQILTEWNYERTFAPVLAHMSCGRH